MNYLLLSENQIDDTTATISDAQQLQHLKTVLKVNVGDTIKIAVLNNNLGTANIAAIYDTSIEIDSIVTETPPPPKLPITLILALPRPKALRRIMMDAVAMGIQEIYLIHSYRVEKSYWQSPHLQKLQSYMELGLSQAGDTILPQVHVKKRFKPFVQDELATIIDQKNACVAHPYANISILESMKTKNQSLETVLIIGAEGGFIDYEVDLLIQAGCQAVSIYQRVLRTETAMSVLVGQLLQ